uniref:Diacylglycerol glucosyltransferase N-terminal domain-containing protein n=1 Tax=Chromera velia CCMP2878 TaxID=1169474 RepID=A0A0G4FSX5_9ALVE|eukprot:Cvel_3670.t1-p1 / transcript=Cvel_3670.t1 / gene=Cvel_3670 / organism=Chromera_velia_CCMP2878 / gene_product=Probable monogalactosyldiacylglycerol synthase,, putative / transcript_product=Probable monogalactosyldiacylglycerol synthase,, putative / location=Cvel_scaffold152:90387-93986(+) / protein_length=1200 / sequence_SO=supercontig / SO=protein_coding / is_pseudo=false
MGKRADADDEGTGVERRGPDEQEQEQRFPLSGFSVISCFSHEILALYEIRVRTEREGGDGDPCLRPAAQVGDASSSPISVWVLEDRDEKGTMEVLKPLETAGGEGEGDTEEGCPCERKFEEGSLVFLSHSPSESLQKNEEPSPPSSPSSPRCPVWLDAAGEELPLEVMETASLSVEVLLGIREVLEAKGYVKKESLGIDRQECPTNSASVSVGEAFLGVPSGATALTRLTGTPSRRRVGTNRQKIPNTHPKRSKGGAGEGKGRGIRREREKKRILILFSDTGGGHRAVAEAVASALDVSFGKRVRVQVVDLLRDHTAWPFSRAPEMYRAMISKPYLWGAFYRFTSEESVLSVTELFALLYTGRHLRSLVASRRPHLIVSVHPAFQHVLLKVLSDFRLPGTRTSAVDETEKREGGRGGSFLRVRPPEGAESEGPFWKSLVDFVQNPLSSMSMTTLTGRGGGVDGKRGKSLSDGRATTVTQGVKTEKERETVVEYEEEPETARMAQIRSFLPFHTPTSGGTAVTAATASVTESRREPSRVGVEIEPVVVGGGAASGGVGGPEDTLQLMQDQLQALLKAGSVKPSRSPSSFSSGSPSASPSPREGEGERAEADPSVAFLSPTAEGGQDEEGEGKREPAEKTGGKAEEIYPSDRGGVGLRLAGKEGRRARSAGPRRRLQVQKGKGGTGDGGVGEVGSDAGGGEGAASLLSDPGPSPPSKRDKGKEKGNTDLSFLLLEPTGKGTRGGTEKGEKVGDAVGQQGREKRVDTGKEKGESRSEIPLVTVVTDFGADHPSWFHKDIAHTFVPTEAVQSEAQSAGVEEEKLSLVGIPVRRPFWDFLLDRQGENGKREGEREQESQFKWTNSVSAESIRTAVLERKRTERAARGWTPQVFVVLLLGGAEGVGITELARGVIGCLLEKIEENSHPAQRLQKGGAAIEDLQVFLVVVCGRNEKAKKELVGAYANLVCGGALESESGDGRGADVESSDADQFSIGSSGRPARHPGPSAFSSPAPFSSGVSLSLCVEGFLQNPSGLLFGADLLVSKAGGASIAEAAACGLPLLISHSLPGQEARNVKFVEEKGFGRACGADSDAEAGRQVGETLWGLLPRRRARWSSRVQEEGGESRGGLGVKGEDQSGSVQRKNRGHEDSEEEEGVGQRQDTEGEAEAAVSEIHRMGLAALDAASALAALKVAQQIGQMLGLSTL